MNTLYLASSSASRKKLLQDAHIPFVVVPQEADESKCDSNQPLRQVVESIARYKMDHVVMPAGKEGDVAWVLTADTLSQDLQGVIHGKPSSFEDAVFKLKAARAGERTGTAFCLEKKLFKAGSWATECSTVHYVDATYIFNVPDAWIERYFKHSPGLQVAGAITIEEYGSLFLESVQGSYSAIVGLPMYELRVALEQFGFWDSF